MPGEEPIPKPKKSLTYREKILAGLVKAKPRSILRSASKKQKKRSSNYEKEKKEYLDRVPMCELCGTHRNLSIHHKAKRGKNMADPKFFMTVCMMNEHSVYYLKGRFPTANFSCVDGCHSFIEANKRLAREMGWLV